MKKAIRVKYGEKNTKEECTRMHKSITGRPFMDCYTLVRNGTLG